MNGFRCSKCGWQQADHTEEPDCKCLSYKRGREEYRFDQRQAKRDREQAALPLSDSVYVLTSHGIMDIGS